MKSMIRKTLVTALLLAALPAAHAAIQTYDFNGSVESGVFTGYSYTGSLSFDDAIFSLDEFDPGYAYAPLTTFSAGLVGEGQSVSLAHAISTPEAYLLNGSFLGASFSAETGRFGFSLVPGTFHVSEAFFAYDAPNYGNSGTGSLNYAAAPVPEPQTYAMLLAGLGLLGFAARRMTKQS